MAVPLGNFNEEIYTHGDLTKVIPFKYVVILGYPCKISGGGSLIPRRWLIETNQLRYPITFKLMDSTSLYC